MARRQTGTRRSPVSAVGVMEKPKVCLISAKRKAHDRWTMRLEAVSGDLRPTPASVDASERDRGITRESPAGRKSL